MPEEMKQSKRQELVNRGKDRAKSRYERHYHSSNPHHKKHLVIDACLGTLVVFLVVLSLYLVVFYRQAVLKEQIEFTLEPAVSSVESGQALEMNLYLENNSDTDLQNAFLTFPVGTGFEIVEANPPLEDGVVNIGTFDRGEALEVTVKGIVLMDIEMPLRLAAALQYRTGGFTGTQQKLISEPLEVSGSRLRAETVVPEAIVANQPFPFSIDYQNFSEETAFDGVVVIPNFPPGWEILESNVELDDISGGWTIDRLGSLETGAIEGRARLVTFDLEEALVGLRVFTSPYGKPLLQGEYETIVPARYPNVEATLTSSARSVSPGNAITVSLNFDNQEEFALNNVRAKLNVNPALFQTRNLSLNDEGQLEVNLSDRLAPNEEASLDQALTVRSQINPTLAFGTGVVQISLDGQILYEDENGQEVSLPLQPLTVGLNSDLGLQAFARYFSAEGDQIGRGPIPPEVGETTKYWIFLQAQNQLHAVDGVVVTAQLPAGVNWTGRSSVTSGDALQVNEGAGTVRWNVGSVADYKNQFDDERYGAAFEVSVSPTVDDAGKVLQILRTIEIQGRDTSTGSILSKTVSPVTTHLTKDAFASDSGEVAF